MLRVEGLWIEQGSFTLSADWQIATGSVTAVLGPSGGGKSTLLGAIAGFVDLQAGRVMWDGTDITFAAPGDRPLTMLFQDHNLFPHLTVAQNVGLGLGSSLRLTREQADKVSDVLARVGLPQMGARKPASLSGGQQSRVALARVLIMDRPLVLLDEPFSALGPGLRTEMLALAVETLKREGRTLIMVTHDPADARAVAEQVVFVDDGVAHAPMATDHAFDAPTGAMRAYLGAK